MWAGLHKEKIIDRTYSFPKLQKEQSQHPNAKDILASCYGLLADAAVVRGRNHRRDQL